MIAPELLLEAYGSGFFPMAEGSDGPIRWYTADPRAIIPLDPFHVPRRLRRFLRSSRFDFTLDRAFERVIRGCADRPSTWISEEMIASFVHLHQVGFAHSVETWRDGILAGGLYGVHLGSAFFGESMFHREAGAAKAALVHLGEHLNARGFRLLEIQMITQATAPFGARHVHRPAYLGLLEQALASPVEW